ncbi:MAG: thaumatin family protein [Deltaproteobacteria bacterium]|nr:thaumatin family protein [Deltaproteobacteria bacterium]
METMLPMKGRSGVRSVFLFWVLLMASFFLLPSFASAYTKALVQFPPLGKDYAPETLSKDLYLYSCTDSGCTSKEQDKEYGHITNVEKWSKSVGGTGTQPAAWVILTLTDNEPSYFEFWQEVSEGWQSCTLGITAQGGLDDTTPNACVGVVAVLDDKPNSIPVFTMGTAMFHGMTTQTTAPVHSEVNTLPDAQVTIINNTSAQTVCIHENDFADTDCTAGGHPVQKGSSLVYDSDSLKNGANSDAAQIVAYKWDEQTDWAGTGKDGQVYATKPEWTIFPQHTNHTVGPSVFDISLVDGFNVGVTLTADRDMVCAISYYEGGPNHFVLYKKDETMATFPKTKENTLDRLCPPEQQVSGGLGCYSACSYANLTDKDIDQMCCIGDYNTAATCTEPPKTDYVKDVEADSTGVYSYGYSDYRGTFTCEGSPSITYTLKDPYNLVPM